MAKKKKVVVTTSSKKNIEPTRSKMSGKPSSSVNESDQDTMLFSKINYLWMFGGVFLIALGLLLMSGGHMPDDNTWLPEKIYSFRRITLAPIVILSGLACQVIAIFKK